MSKDRPATGLAEAAACAFIALFGIASLMVGLEYRIGTVQRMGPGFFPVATSIAIIGLAVVSALESFASKAPESTFRWRPVIFVSLGVIAWCLLIDSAGLIPSTFALILLSSLAKPPFRSVALLILSAAICLAGYLIFIEGLGMPMSLFGR